MQNVANFIKLLGENYYLDFIIDPNSEEVSYERHFILVHYQDKNYYEITFEQIKIRQRVSYGVQKQTKKLKEIRFLKLHFINLLHKNENKRI